MTATPARCWSRLVRLVRFPLTRPEVSWCFISAPSSPSSFWSPGWGLSSWLTALPQSCLLLPEQTRSTPTLGPLVLFTLPVPHLTQVPEWLVARLQVCGCMSLLKGCGSFPLPALLSPLPWCYLLLVFLLLIATWSVNTLLSVVSYLSLLQCKLQEGRDHCLLSSMILFADVFLMALNSTVFRAWETLSICWITYVLILKYVS